MQSRLLFTLLIGLLTAGCSSKEKEVLFESVQGTGIIFENKVTDTDSLNIVNYRNFYNGGGVATGDINNDGWMDVFFTANQGPNKLFLNKGDWTFEDISERAGFGPKQQYSTGVVMVDINADGWLDIFVCNAGSLRDPALRKNQLFINNQHLGFTEQAEQYGLADSGYTTQVSFFDYDLDGDLDCFQIDNSPVEVSGLGYPRLRDLEARNWSVEEQFKSGGDHLYRNDNGKFVEVTRAAGIHGTLTSFGMGVSVGDINGDHYPDIFVAIDFFERDYLYINQQD
ncbi:MAG: RNA-binding protein, partial [Sphingobacteriales bacterium 12-47-4]